MISFSIGRPRIDLFNPKKILFVLWLFLLVFPKGGIRLLGIPVTWGYLLLGLTFLYAVTRRSWVIQSPRITALVCLFPFQLVSFLAMCVNGRGDLGMTVSFYISFFFLPYAFLCIFSKFIESEPIDLFLDLLKKGVAFISYYGILLFIYKQTMGKYLEIPFITVNWGDVGTLDNFKCNSRGLVSKLISTYNNGQIFGISMTLLLPLYCHVQKNRWHRFATKLALFLTLSRTTWIGLVTYELFCRLITEEKKKQALVRLFVTLSLLLIGFSLIAYSYGFGLSFIFDANLGGRREQLDILETSSFFPTHTFGGFPDMVYVGIIESFGYIGLITYLIAMAGPLLIYSFTDRSKIRFCITFGLLNYLFISISDGAPLYIPILAFYWFLMSLLARRELEPSQRLPAN